MDIEAILSKQPVVTCCGYSLGGEGRGVPGEEADRLPTMEGLDTMPRSF